ncbi:MAG TPA: SMC family ATPase, partial [Mycobacteriales bacterium]|nr:SMC family ATPase [Mycobacteriales bacterium]
DALAGELAAAGVRVPAGRPLAETAEAAVAAAEQEARSAAERVAERRAEAAELAATRDAAEEQAQVAKLLGQVLRADGFERWLLASALDVLVADAGRTLLELSGGQFELTHDGKDFAVVDHADADSLRPVRTLSGGETFQASLALALALSAQLAGLAAAGAARLDAIVLDEGFGSLDEATLDVVAGTLESLTAGGDRMVGVVTHVAALAERVPVRFAVRRGPAGSTVVREER